jgi:hypothetical protein
LKRIESHRPTSQEKDAIRRHQYTQPQFRGCGASLQSTQSKMLEYQSFWCETYCSSGIQWSCNLRVNVLCQERERRSGSIKGRLSRCFGTLSLGSIFLFRAVWTGRVSGLLTTFDIFIIDGKSFVNLGTKSSFFVDPGFSVSTW